ncbi:unnamed protein product, partial [Mesorhabditis spiculigera]
MSEYHKSDAAVPEVTLPGPIAPGTDGEAVDLYSNFFKLDVSGETMVYKYELDVTASRYEDMDDVTKKHVMLTREPAQGGLRLVYREICSRIVKHCITSENGLPNWNTCMFYDQHRLLYVIGRRIDSEGMITARYPLPDERLYAPFKFARLEFRYAGQMTLSNSTISELTGPLARTKDDQSANCYVEVAVSKSCFENLENGQEGQARKFLCFSRNRIFLRNPVEAQDSNLSEQKQILLGSKKSVELIAGEGNQPQLALNIDAEKGCFLKAGPILDTARRICNVQSPTVGWSMEAVEKLNRVLKGVLVGTSYAGMHQNFRIDRIVPETARNARFETKEGKTWTVEEYFKQHRNVAIEWPLAPLAEVKRGPGRSHFPLEFLAAYEGHIVPTAKQTPEIMKTFVRSAAMVPDYRQGAIMNLIKEQNIGLDLSQSAHLKVNTVEPIGFKARKIPAPLAVYQPGSANISQGTWRKPQGAGFLVPKTLQKWAFFAVSDRPISNFDAQRFTQGFADECKKRQMNLPPCAYMDVLGSEKLEWAFMNLRQNGFDFALFAMEDQLKLQDRLKYLERTFEVASQNMKWSTAQAIMTGRKAATLENIVQKFNVKLGGQNYAVRRGKGFTSELHKGEALVLGIGPVELMKDLDEACFQKLGGQSSAKPVVLSYSGNFGEVNGSFIGDFVIEKFANPQDAKVMGGNLVAKALTALQAVPGRMDTLKRVVIYRSGTIDTDLQRIAAVEVPMILGKIREALPGKSILFTYIMAHKDHHVRFFNQKIVSGDTPAKKNIPPGTVVDRFVISPHGREFYLNAHTALQGTAKAPKYTVLYDDANLSMDYLQGMTYDLCHMHQIVNLPTALPSPLRIAAEYGDRGRRLFNEFMKGHDAASAVDFHALEYCNSSTFKARRINA